MAERPLGYSECEHFPRGGVSLLAYDVLQHQSLSRQVGEVESYLESILVEFFRRRPEVVSAFLARARLYPDAQTRVALCLRVIALEHATLVAYISAVFHEIFHPDQRLSIVFLTAHQEGQVGSFARPFYAAFAQEEALYQEASRLSSPHATHSRALHTFPLDTEAAVDREDRSRYAGLRGDGDTWRRSG